MDLIHVALLPATHAAARPDAVAVRFAGADITYAMLAHRVRCAASTLWHTHGVRPGDRVAYLGLNHVDQLALLFALSHIGAALVPLNYRLAPAEWRGVMADCTPVLLVHDDAWRDAAHGLSESVDALLDIAAQCSEDGPAVPMWENPQAPALLVYTSGTTGAPRAAVHTQANLLANMTAARAVQEMTAADRVLTVLPMFHVGGLCIQTLPALMAGAVVLLHARFDATAAIDCIQQDKPTLTLQVPATMKALLEHPRWSETDLSSLRAMWAGSSLLPDDLVRAFLARGLAVCNVYGATETGPFSIALGPLQSATHAGSCGWPAPGVEVRLEAVGDAGEVLMRGPAIARCYWPDVAAVDDDGWFHSGDLARQADDGSYTIVGRVKDMIISGGENIYPAEIETLLARHPAVGECAVVGIADAKWGEVAVAAVVPRAASSAGAVPGEHELLDFLAPQLARYKLPRRILSVADLPRTALGKVQKNLLAVELQRLIAGGNR